MGGAAASDVAGGLDDLGHGEAELAQALVARGGDFEDAVAAGFQLGADEFGHVLAVGEVHLVERHQPGTVVQGHDFAVLAGVAHVHRVLFELGLDDGEVGERVAVRFEGAAVQDVHQGGATLHVAQEVVAEALAFAGAFDQAGNVGDGEADFAGLDHTEVGDQGGERVVGDLGPGSGHGGDEAGLAGGREAHQGDVGDGLQFQDDVAGFAFDAEQGEARGAALLGGQGRVAQAAQAAGGGDVFGAFAHEVGQDGAVLGLDHGAVGDGEDQGFAVLAAAPVAHAGAAVGGVPVRCVVVVQERGGLVVHAEDDVAAVAAVAAVGPAQGLELLAVDGDTPVAAGTAGYVQYYPVYKAGHVDLLSAVSWQPVGAKTIVMRLKEQWSGPSGPLHRFRTWLLLCSCSSNDVDDATTAAGTEFNGARGQCEQGVVAAAAYAGARVEVGAALADDDFAGRNYLATEALDAQVLSVGVTTVASGARALFMCHLKCLPLNSGESAEKPETVTGGYLMPVILTLVSS